MRPELPVHLASDESMPAYRPARIALVAIPALLWIGCLVYFLTVTREQAARRAEAQVLSDATLLTTRLEAVLNRVGASISMLQRRLASGIPSMPVVEGFLAADDDLARMAQDFPEIDGIFLFGQHGKPRIASTRVAASVDISDREYFRDASQQDSSAIRFSRVARSRVSGRVAMAAYAPVRGPSGDFVGVISIPVDLQYLEDAFRKSPAGERGLVALRRTEDARLVLRYPIPPEGSLTEGVNTGILDHLRDGLARGLVMKMESPIDGIERIQGFAKVGRFPFYVTVGYATADVFADWKRSALLAVGTNLLALAIVIAMVRRSHGQALAQKRLGDRLRESEARLRLATDADGYGWYDADLVRGTIGESGAWHAWLGYPDRTEPMPLADWLAEIHDDDLGKVRALYDAMADSDELPPTEFRRRAGDRSWRWVRLACRVTERDATGRPQRAIGMMTDVSADRAKEQALRENATELAIHRDRLEELVAERTEELARAKQRAESASVAKGAFLANMSHEIRTPLNAINGMAHILRRDGATSSQLEKIERIERAGRHVLEIINSVLELSKIEAGKLELHEQEFEVGEIFASVTSMVQDRAAGKGLQLIVDSQIASQRFMGDATRLREALLNYAMNAVKFTDQGSITLRALALSRGEHDALLRFEVEDTGIGIAAEDLPRLFSAFEQIRSGAVGPVGGTGLGLAITRRLAELMGGDAGVESTFGKGSTFWFTARLRTTDVTESDAGNATFDMIEATVRDRHAGKDVLVAEDEPVNLEVVRFLLERTGLEVHASTDGAQAVAMAAAHRFALILMDVQMPVLDGLEATRRVRALAGYEATPILALTANAFSEDRERCFAAGASDFVAKPVEPILLLRSILRLLDQSTTTDTLAHPV